MSSVVIIGAGLAGLSSARALQKRGWQVTVVDAQTSPAQGTSFANAGMLTPSMADPWNAPGLLPYLLKSLGREDASFLLRLNALPGSIGWGLRFLAQSRQQAFLCNSEANFHLARYSLSQLRQWQAELNMQYEQRENGTLKIFRSAQALQTALHTAQQLQTLGLKVEALNANQVAQQEPALDAIKEQLCGGLFYPEDASGNARKFCQAISAELVANGAQLHFNERWQRWRWRRGRISGFSSNCTDYDADVVVVAAGVYSPQLLRPLNLDLMVRPVKGYSLTLTTEGVENLPSRPVIDEALHCAITPFSNSLRVAGTAELAGYSRHIPTARMHNLKRMLSDVLPQQAPRLLKQTGQEWAGLRPMSAEGLPYIGRLSPHGPLANLALNTGHGHLGWTHAVGSAELLATELCGEQAAINPAAYAAQRLLK